MWIVDILNTICIFFDWLVYSLATTAYVLFATMCKMNVSAFGDTIKSLVSRVEVFFGIVMLFVVAFNLIQFLTEPSKLEKGAGNLVKKIAISIVLIASMNYIFNLFDRFQTAILDSDTIQSIILGTEGGKAKSSFKTDIATAKYFSYNTLFSFVTEEKETIKPAVMNGKENLWYVVEHINDKGVEYKYPIVSTAAGLLLIVMFISFAIDIGARVFNLLILQVIAPIPILAYIVPGGESILKKYFKSYIQIYLELFVKIAISYLTLYLMSVTMKAIILDVSDGGIQLFSQLDSAGNLATPFFKVMLFVLVMVAIFTFIKKVPQLLASIFGLKLGGGSFGSTGAMLKGLGLGALGLGAGAVGGTIGAAVAGGGVGAAALGGIKGALGGAQSGYKAKGVKDFFDGQSKNIKNQYQYGNKVGAQGGLFRSNVTKAAKSADTVAGAFRGDKRKYAQNQVARNKNQAAIDKNKRAQEAAIAKMTAYQNNRKKADELKNMAANKVYAKWGGKEGYINEMTANERAAYKAAESKGDKAAMVYAEQKLNDRKAQVSSEVDSTAIKYVDSNVNNAKAGASNYDADIVSQYNDIANERNSFAAEVESSSVANMNDLLSSDAKIEGSLQNSLGDLRNEESSLNQEASRLDKELKDIGDTTTGKWVKDSESKAVESAARLGHAPDNK